MKKACASLVFFLILLSVNFAHSYDNSSLSGGYRFINLGSTADEWFSEFGIYTFNGAGSHTSVYDTNSSRDGLITGRTDSGTYSVSSDGSLVIHIDNGTDMKEGITKPGDGIIVFSDLDSAGQPTVTVGIPSGNGGFSASDLNGKYHVATFGVSSAVLDRWSEQGTITFDGTGGYTYSVTYSSTRDGANLVDTGSGSYTVADDGAVTFYGFPDDPWGTVKGAIQPGAGLIIAADVDEQSEQIVAVFIKAGNSGFTNASLNGTYYGVQFLVNSSGRTSSFDRIEFDGTGNFTVFQRYNSSSAGANQAESFGGTYSVNPDGTFTINCEGEITNSALSESGNAFVTARVNDRFVQDMGFFVLPAIACPTQPFTDVPSTHWAFDYINAIKEAGITTGYGDGSYGPEDPVSRDQMAVFIIRALYGETFTYSSTPYFTDVPSSHWAFKYVQKLKELGITTGCGYDQYCPLELVTRDQMAAFLIRAKIGEDFSYDPNPYFTDVTSDHWAFDYIQKLKELGITTGCGSDRYCPNEIVTRDQMAAFLTRAFLQ